MIRQYTQDIASIALVLILAFLLSGRPSIDLSVHPSVSHEEASEKSSSAEQQKKEVIKRRTVSDDILKNRNIFAESGSYAAPGVIAGQALPPNPYKLISVLQGKEKKAVFREYTGAVVTLPVGKKMIDDFIITKIESVSVKLKKDKEEKELRLFSAGGGQIMTADDKEKNLPANPYTLIGILGGKEKKAVIKDYKGSVSILTVGAKLIDGSVIKGIDPVSVKLKKGKEQIELRIFGGHSSLAK
ncbi:MAG: hypothetical protein ABSE05_15650 [Syntrophales bacterium]|jgi:hypothetical protein